MVMNESCRIFDNQFSSSRLYLMMRPLLHPQIAPVVLLLCLFLNGKLYTKAWYNNVISSKQTVLPASYFVTITFLVLYTYRKDPRSSVSFETQVETFTSRVKGTTCEILSTLVDFSAHKFKYSQLSSYVNYRNIFNVPRSWTIKSDIARRCRHQGSLKFDKTLFRICSNKKKSHYICLNKYLKTGVLQD